MGQNGADDRKRGWPRLPWRPSELKWTHALSRYACLEPWRKEEERTLSSLLAHHQPRFTAGRLQFPLFLSSPSLSPPRDQRNYAKSSTRKIRDTTSRRVSTSTCCIAISREILHDDGFVFSTTTTTFRSGSMGTFSFRGDRQLRKLDTDRRIETPSSTVSQCSRV